MARVFISVGSNIKPEDNVLRALKMLSRRTRITSISTFYLTEAEDRPDQPEFYNGVVEIKTDIPPTDLKRDVLRVIEEQLGRRRTEDRWAPRTIDLDILMYDDLVMDQADLIIPDPQIADRPFLSVPLYELAPDLKLPHSGLPLKDIAEMHRNHTMLPLSDYTEILRAELTR